MESASVYFFKHATLIPGRFSITSELNLIIDGTVYKNGHLTQPQYRELPFFKGEDGRCIRAIAFAISDVETLLVVGNCHGYHSISRRLIQGKDWCGISTKSYHGEKQLLETTFQLTSGETILPEQAEGIFTHPRRMYVNGRMLSFSVSNRRSDRVDTALHLTPFLKGSLFKTTINEIIKEIKDPTVVKYPISTLCEEESLKPKR